MTLGLSIPIREGLVLCADRSRFFPTVNSYEDVQKLTRLSAQTGLLVGGLSECTDKDGKGITVQDIVEPLVRSRTPPELNGNLAFAVIQVVDAFNNVEKSVSMSIAKVLTLLP